VIQILKKAAKLASEAEARCYVELLRKPYGWKVYIQSYVELSLALPSIVIARVPFISPKIRW
jgi:hypothetical protein